MHKNTNHFSKSVCNHKCDPLNVLAIFFFFGLMNEVKSALAAHRMTWPLSEKPLRNRQDVCGRRDGESTRSREEEVEEEGGCNYEFPLSRYLRLVSSSVSFSILRCLRFPLTFYLFLSSVSSSLLHQLLRFLPSCTSLWLML